MKITAPNYTQTPNDLFDHWLPHLNESELKVLLVIMRKTFGWHKVRDRISISQLQQITGLSETSVLGAIKSLLSKGVIYKEVVGEAGKQQTFYELRVHDSNNSYPPSKWGPPESGDPQMVGGTPPVSGDTKETPSKETDFDSDALKRGEKKSGVKVSFPRDMDGKPIDIDESEIYRRMVPFDFPTSVVSEAIEKLRVQTAPIRDIYRYIETTCQNLIKSNTRKAIAEEKNAKSIKKDSGAPPKYEGPMVNMGELLGLKPKST